MSTRRSPFDGDVSRAALVEAAERLFAEHDIGSVSIREINREAGLAPAAVHYHFGSKEGIVQAVLRRIGDQVNARYVENTLALASSRRTPMAREVIDAWAVPVMQAIDDDPVRAIRWLRVTAQIPSKESLQLWPDAGLAWKGVMARAFPAVAEETQERAWAFAALTLPRLLARSPGGTTPEEQHARSDYMASCVDFVAFGFAGMLRAARLVSAARGSKSGAGGERLNRA